MLLKNKTAVVTGCNKGIGKKILETFSLNGATIFACVRKVNDEFKDFAEKLAKKNNNKIFPISFDLANENEIKEAANKIISSGSSIDILINNAAIIQTSIFQMTSVKILRDVFELSKLDKVKKESLNSLCNNTNSIISKHGAARPFFHLTSSKDNIGLDLLRSTIFKLI